MYFGNQNKMKMKGILVMKNRLKTILLTLLSIVMIFSLVACKKTADQGEGETTDSQETTQSSGESDGPVYKYDANGYVMDNLPDDLDFGAEDFTILMWKEWVRYDFVVDESSASAAWSQELLERQYAVEDRLNISFNFMTQAGNWDKRAEFLGVVEADQMNETSSFDLIGTYGPTMANLTVNGYISNLNATKYVDADMPWWNAQQVESATVNDKLYFVTGDITPSTVMTMSCVLGNESLLNQYGHTNLYDLVYNGDWTLSKMMEIALDNTNAEDIYGITILQSRGTALVHGAGMSYVERNDSGRYQLGKDITDQKGHTFWGVLQDLFGRENVKHSVEKITDNADFAMGKAFFHMGNVGNIENVKDRAFDFIVLPMPKYDKAQTNYYSVTDAWNTLYGVPNKVANADMSSAVLEALASQAHRALMPVVFEECFSTKFVADPEDSAMVQMIYDCLVYDPAQLYNEAFGTLAASWENVKDPTSSWSGVLEAHKSSWVAKVAALNDNLK